MSGSLVRLAVRWLQSLLCARRTSTNRSIVSGIKEKIGSGPRTAIRARCFSRRASTAIVTSFPNLSMLCSADLPRCCACSALSWRPLHSFNCWKTRPRAEPNITRIRQRDTLKTLFSSGFDILSCAAWTWHEGWERINSDQWAALASSFLTRNCSLILVSEWSRAVNSNFSRLIP